MGFIWPPTPGYSCGTIQILWWEALTFYRPRPPNLQLPSLDIFTGCFLFNHSKSVQASSKAAPKTCVVLYHLDFLGQSDHLCYSEISSGLMYLLRIERTSITPNPKPCLRRFWPQGLIWEDEKPTAPHKTLKIHMLKPLKNEDDGRWGSSSSTADLIFKVFNLNLPRV